MKKSCNISTQFLKKLYDYSKLNPNKIAIVDNNGKRKTTYSDYVQIVNSIAYWMHNQGICKGDIVAIVLGRCMEHYAVRMACHFIGAVCMTINPDTPDFRKKAIYSEARPKIIINNDALLDIKFSSFECQIDKSLTDKDHGYIVYTSGSTGVPKGILHDRSLYEIYQNCMDHINNPAYEKVGRKPTNNHAAVADMSFVLSYIDMALLFCHGCIHIISEFQIKDLNSLKQYFMNNAITSTFILPSLLNALLPLYSLVYACVAGEKSNFDFSDYKTQIFNVYGSSESPVMAFSEYGDNKIGNNFGNSKVNLIDESNVKLKTTDTKHTGEIIFSGPGMMVGYVNDSILSSKAIQTDKKTNKKNISHKWLRQIYKWRLNPNIGTYG